MDTNRPGSDFFLTESFNNIDSLLFFKNIIFLNGRILTFHSSFHCQACPNVFSAGLDILEMYQPDKKRLPNFWSTLQASWLNLYSCSMPSVAVINVSIRKNKIIQYQNAALSFCYLNV